MMEKTLSPEFYDIDSVGNEENTSTHPDIEDSEILCPDTSSKAGSECTSCSTRKMKTHRRCLSLPSVVTRRAEPEDVELDLTVKLSDLTPTVYRVNGSCPVHSLDHFRCCHRSPSKTLKSTHFHDVQLSHIGDTTCDHACFPSTSYAGSSHGSIDSLSGISYQTEKTDHFQDKFLDLYIDRERRQEGKNHQPDTSVCFSDIANTKKSIAAYDRSCSCSCSFDEVVSSTSSHNCPLNPTMFRTSHCSSIENISSLDVDDKHLNRPISSPRDSILESSCPFECISVHDALDGACNYDPLVEEYGIDFYVNLKEVEERAMVVLKELCDERFFPVGRRYISVPASLYYRIRRLTEEQSELLQKMSAQLQGLLLERDCHEKKWLLIKKELILKIHSLKKDKSEVQHRFHREMEVTNSKWAFKLDEMNLEHKRLRDQMKLLVEQNVSLQREISSFYIKEVDETAEPLSLELDELDEVKSDNLGLQKALSWTQSKLRSFELETTLAQNYCEEKEKENKELLTLVTILQSNCSEQESTIGGGPYSHLNLDDEGKWSPDGFDDSPVIKLEDENLRLKQTLRRRQMEIKRQESNNTRYEKLVWLRWLGEVGSSSSSVIKLEQELLSAVHCLQNLGLSLICETIQTNEELLSVMYRRKDCNNTKLDQILLASKEDHRGLDQSFLEEYTFMNCDIKIRGYKHRLQLLVRSLQRIDLVIEEKLFENVRWTNFHDISSEEEFKSDLKAEMLTLKEKIYTKEQEVEQLQANLVIALRNQEILESKIQRVADASSFTNQRMKDMELEMFKKKDSINQLQRELQLTMEELNRARKLLSQVSKERDSMWEELKQKSEENMLLNHEVISLRKKVEGLEEDTLVKDGQITILKDSLRRTPFDFLSDYE